MAGVRIKDLQDAKGVIEGFDDMQFAVDSATPDATMRQGRDEFACLNYFNFLYGRFAR
jgi:hypothetical protein